MTDLFSGKRHKGGIELAPYGVMVLKAGGRRGSE
jgi:hypothetical protein